MNIGKKIRDIRRQKGLTQAELAQNVITRNMLSQIESGKATPSLPTLLHIASVLEIPAEFFISESEDIEAFTKEGFVSELKQLYSKKRYGDCLFIFEKANRRADDEIALILATCALECGKRHLKNGNLVTAQEFFDKCSSFSKPNCLKIFFLNASEQSALNCCENIIFNAASLATFLIIHSVFYGRKSLTKSKGLRTVFYASSSNTTSWTWTSTFATRYRVIFSTLYFTDC